MAVRSMMPASACLVEQQTDTMILHNAAHFHGTTLHKRDPNVKTTDIVHAGFSLLVGRGLHQRYAEYLASKALILLSAAKSRVQQLSVDTAMPDAPPMQEDVAMIHKLQNPSGMVASRHDTAFRAQSNAAQHQTPSCLVFGMGIEVGLASIAELPPSRNTCC